MTRFWIDPRPETAQPGFVDGQPVDPEGQTGEPRWVPGCTDCQSGTPVSHWPSRRCDSGGHPHCTCDACF